MSSTVYCVIYSAYIGGQGHIFSRSKKTTKHLMGANFWVLEVKKKVF